MQREHYKVEAATIAHSSGNLTYESWSHDVILALGLSAVRNPIGFWLVRMFSETTPNSGSLRSLAQSLDSELKKRGVQDGGDAAKCAVAHVHDSRCPHCQGRGVIDFNQAPCKRCNGTGRRDTSGYPSNVRAGIDILLEMQDWIDGQIRARTKALAYSEPDGKSLRLPADGMLSNAHRYIGDGGYIAMPTTQPE